MLFYLFLWQHLPLAVSDTAFGSFCDIFFFRYGDENSKMANGHAIPPFSNLISIL